MCLDRLGVVKIGRLFAGPTLGLVAAALLWPTLALAHATLIRASPPDLCPGSEQAFLVDPDPRCATGQILTEPPGKITLIFSEQAQPAGGGITVLSPSGQNVAQGKASASGAQLTVGVDAREQGTYLVTWRVISGDTHPAWGRYVFSVGHSSPLPGVDTQSAANVAQIGTGLQALGHWLHFAGYALAFGTLLFILYALGAAAPSLPLWRLVNTGVFALLLAEIPGLFGQMAGLGTGQFFSLDLLTALLTSSYGLALAQRLGAALALWVLLGVVGPGASLSAQRWLWVALLPGLALAVIDGEASHAVGVQPLWFALAINAVHVAAMGCWLGGLLALIMVWRGAAQRPVLLRRFARLAGSALLLLIASGTLLALAHIRGLADLFNSGYGVSLAIKIGLVALAAALAAAGLRVGLSQRVRFWTLELAALGAVLALAAALVTLPPPV